MSWHIKYSKQAVKDAKKLKAAGLKPKAEQILKSLMNGPSEPPTKKLAGDLSGLYSRRINIQHRIVFQLDKADEVIQVLRMWTHYGE